MRSHNALLDVHMLQLGMFVSFISSCVWIKEGVGIRIVLADA